MIEVTQTRLSDPFEFEVVVRDTQSETRHRVTLDKRTGVRLGAGRHAPERCVEAAFRFLLDREPKEAILGRFDIAAIAQYFPEFERELSLYLLAS